MGDDPVLLFEQYPETTAPSSRPVSTIFISTPGRIHSRHTILVMIKRKWSRLIEQRDVSKVRDPSTGHHAFKTCPRLPLYYYPLNPTLKNIPSTFNYLP